MGNVTVTGCLRTDNTFDEYEVTLPIPIPVAFTKIEGDFTLTDSKLWLMLLHLSWDDLLTHSKVGVWHEITESELIELFSKYSGTKDIERLWNAGRRLSKTIVEYQRIDKNEERWMGITTMFHCEYKPKQKRNGIFRYMFPSPLVDLFLDPKIYVRLRLLFVLRLKSKYSVRLYQLLESVANLDCPELDVSVENLRGFLNVPDGKLSSWSEFYRFALLPSIREINENPEISWIFIDHRLVRRGKGGRVQRVIFSVTKTQQRLEFEEQIKGKKRNKKETQKDILKNQNDAIDLVLYFHKKKNGRECQKKDILEREIKEAQKTIDAVESLEQAKKYVDIALESKNPPDFMGGLKFHRSRIIPLLQDQQKFKQRREKIQEQEERRKREEDILYEEFMEYYLQLDQTQIDEIIEGIDLNKFEKDIIHKNTNAGENLRKNKVLDEWKKIRDGG